MASTSMHPTQAVPSSTQEPIKVKQEEGYEPSTSTQKVDKKPVVKDPYHGHEDTAKMAARFIISLFNCPTLPPQTGPNSPQPPLSQFIAYSLHRTRLPHFVTLVGLLLLQRLKARYPSARGSSGHRLFISAFMIASKIVCDDTYSNQSWCIVAQKMFTLKEMNQMEREMCGYLEWNLNASSSEIDAFEAKLKAEHSNLIYHARRSAIKAQQTAQHVDMVRREQEHQLQQQQQQQQARPSSSASSGSRPMTGIESTQQQRITAALPQRTPFTKAWASRPPSMTAVTSNGSSSSSSATASSSSRRLATPMATSTPPPPPPPPSVGAPQPHYHQHAQQQTFQKRAPPTRVASTSSVPTQMATLSSSVNSLSNGQRVGPYMQQAPRLHTASANDVPTFHPGSTAPVVGNISNSPFMNGRRGSKTALAGPNGKLTSASRSSSNWSLNMLNGSAGNANANANANAAKRDETSFRSGELARSGSGAGTYVNTLSARQYGLDGYDDADEDDVDGSGAGARYAMAISPGPVVVDGSTIHALSTTWPRTMMDRQPGGGSLYEPSRSHLQAPPMRTSRRQHFRDAQSIPSSPGSSASHLHNSPHPSLTNDSSNQSSPDSQVCQTPSPVASIHRPTHERSMSSSMTVRGGSKPMAIRGGQHQQRYQVAVE